MPENCTLDEAQTLVTVKFKVWCPILKRGHNLCLVGSHPKLGDWNTDVAPIALSTSDPHIWKVETSLSSDASFKWNWVMVKAKQTHKVKPQLITKVTKAETKPEWESSKMRERKLNGFSGTLHTVWGEEEEVFLQSVTSVELTTFRTVRDGQHLVVTGSSPSTGNWVLKDAVRATEFPPKSGHWKANCTFDATNVISFKWTVVNDKNPSQPVEQEAAPHRLCGARGWLKVAAPWNKRTIVVLERAVRDDTLDDVMGRSDMLVTEKKKRQAEIKQWLVSKVSATKQPKTARQPHRNLTTSTAHNNKLHADVDQKADPNMHKKVGTMAIIGSNADSKIASNVDSPNSKMASMVDPKVGPKLEAKVDTKIAPRFGSKLEPPRNKLSRMSSFQIAKSRPVSGSTLSMSPQTVYKLDDSGYSSSGALFLKGKGQTRFTKDLTTEEDDDNILRSKLRMPFEGKDVPNSQFPSVRRFNNELNTTEDNEYWRHAQTDEFINTHPSQKCKIFAPNANHNDMKINDSDEIAELQSFLGNIDKKPLDTPSARANVKLDEAIGTDNFTYNDGSGDFYGDFKSNQHLDQSLFSSFANQQLLFGDNRYCYPEITKMNTTEYFGNDDLRGAGEEITQSERREIAKSLEKLWGMEKKTTKDCTNSCLGLSRSSVAYDVTMQGQKKHCPLTIEDIAPNSLFNHASKSNKVNRRPELSLNSAVAMQDQEKHYPLDILDIELDRFCNLSPKSNNVNHRENARELERQWANSYSAKKSSIMQT